MKTITASSTPTRSAHSICSRKHRRLVSAGVTSQAGPVTAAGGICWPRSVLRGGSMADNAVQRAGRGDRVGDVPGLVEIRASARGLLGTGGRHHALNVTFVDPPPLICVSIF